MKSTQEEYAFHERVLAGDPVAFSQLAEWLYADLVRDTGSRARARSGGGGVVDMDLIEESVGRALLEYNDQPQRYDPEQASIRTYMVMAAYRDYLNAVTKEWRHTQRQATLTGEGMVDLEIADGRQELEELLTRISAEEWWGRIKDDISDPVDRQVMVLVMNGVRATDRYARLLGLETLPVDEQAREVKKAKDRIAKRLRRLGEAYDERV